MSAENTSLAAVEVGESGELPGAAVAVDTTTLDGAAAVGSVEIEGVNHACVIVVYPADDVAALNVSSLGSAVRTALLSVS